MFGTLLLIKFSERVGRIGRVIGAVALLFSDVSPVLADTPVISTAVIVSAPAQISANPFPAWLQVGGLVPDTDYLYTARLRSATSISDFGSFWNGSAFTTSYSVAGHTDSGGNLALRSVIKPGSLTAPVAIRLRFKKLAIDPTPSPMDLPFAPAFLTGSQLSGHAYHLGALTTIGWVQLLDGGNQVLQTTGVGAGSVNPWSSDLGFYSFTVGTGSYRLRLVDQNLNLLFQSDVVTAGGSALVQDLDPPPPPVYLRQVFLSELLPDPVGTDTDGEFIELENRDTAPVDLSGWKLSDASGKVYAFPSGVILGAGAFLMVPYSDSKITLNNDAETLTLTDPSGKIHDSAEYGDSKEGESWSFNPVTTPTGFSWSLKPTPGAVNEFPSPPPAPEIPVSSISEARADAAGAEVRIQGVVTAPYGLLGSKIWYIQYGPVGIQLYGGEGFSLGELVDVTGTLSSYHGERRVKVAEAVGVEMGVLPGARELDRSPDESDEGQLVVVRGRIIKLSGQNVFIGTPGGEVKVTFKTTIGWKRPHLKTGDLIEVTGIVSQYTDAEAPDEGYRVLPRFATDFRLLESVQPKAKAKQAKTSVDPVEIPTVQAAGARTVTTSHPNPAGALLEWLGLITLSGALYYASRNLVGRRDEESGEAAGPKSPGR